MDDAPGAAEKEENYRALDPDKIVATLRQLQRRVSERFPGAGLAKVCAELTEIARESRRRSARLRRPSTWLRLGTWSAMVLGAGLLVYIATLIEVRRDAENLSGVLQGIDAAFNILVLMGAAAFFLSTLETRWKRQQALADLHELRSIVHVIDMHQLTKDPNSTVSAGRSTPSSPKRTLSAFEVTRYLDYCSEMLSLTAKIAALYAQSSRDDVVVNAVNDLERLTANLSQKIWQKINIVQANERASGGWVQDQAAQAEQSARPPATSPGEPGNDNTQG